MSTSSTLVVCKRNKVRTSVTSVEAFGVEIDKFVDDSFILKSHIKRGHISLTFEISFEKVSKKFKRGKILLQSSSVF